LSSYEKQKLLRYALADDAVSRAVNRQARIQTRTMRRDARTGVVADIVKTGINSIGGAM
jgi:hypothetical protein